MPIKGDFAKLQRLQEALAATGREGAQEAAERAAKEVEKMIKGQFRRAETPEGEKWPRRKKDGKKALRNLQVGFAVAREGTATQATFPKLYATYHERGTRNMPARPFVPTADREMPERWRRRIYSAALWAVYRLMKRQRTPPAPPTGD